MGFQLPNTTITIDFPADHELHGLEVKAGTVPLGTYLELSRLAGSAEGNDAESTAALRALVDQFALVALKDWNLEDEHGRRVEPSAAGLLAMDARYALSLITAWMTAAGGTVPAPLDEQSPGGAPSVVELPPMELASGSPTS